eukprot:UN02277
MRYGEKGEKTMKFTTKTKIIKTNDIKSNAYKICSLLVQISWGWKRLWNDI